MKMKTNIVFLFAALFAVMLISCTDEADQLLPIVADELAVTNDSVLIHSNPLSDELRSLRPSTSQQMDDGAVQPDRRGEKGRDHREWYDVIGNGRFKNFDTGSLLSPGELYAIDPDGVNAYIFKFFFPEEFRKNIQVCEGLRISIRRVEEGYLGTWVNYYGVYYAYPFQFDDCFKLPRDYFHNWDVIEYSVYADYKTNYISHGQIQFSDLVIIKQKQ